MRALDPMPSLLMHRMLPLHITVSLQWVKFQLLCHESSSMPTQRAKFSASAKFIFCRCRSRDCLPSREDFDHGLTGQSIGTTQHPFELERHSDWHKISGTRVDQGCCLLGLGLIVIHQQAHHHMGIECHRHAHS